MNKTEFKALVEIKKQELISQIDSICEVMPNTPRAKVEKSFYQSLVATHADLCKKIVGSPTNAHTTSDMNKIAYDQAVVELINERK